MSTSVKHIHSGMRGAPAISGTAGTLIAAIDAFFITGWGGVTALSGSVASGIATLLFSPGDSFDRDAVVLVSGATPGDVNGEARVLTSSNTSITFATEAADGVITGVVAVKYAPQTSWVKVYSGTNKAVYRSTHVQANGHYLRVDDTGTTTARVRGFESMSDVDTGSGPFPTDAQMNGGGYWWKSVVANANPAKWMLFSDERMLLVSIAAGSSGNALNLGASLRGFGDPIALSGAGDVWSTVISHHGSNSASSPGGALDSSLVSSVAGQCCQPRAFSALGGSVIADPRSFVGQANNTSGNDGWLGSMPSAIDGRIMTSRVFLMERVTAAAPRAIVPGVHYIPQSGAAYTLSYGDKLDGSGDLEGRRLMVLLNAPSHSASPNSAHLIDITGPWR